VASAQNTRSRDCQPLGIQPRGEAAHDDLGLEITHAQMVAAVSAGDATPFTLGGSWLTGYHGAWWVLSEIGWLRITDDCAGNDGQVHQELGGLACSCGFTPTTGQELNSHFLAVFIPAGSVGHDGAKHEPVA
jgi:hypothetical protein